jgi:hypothetical protein
MVKYLQIRKLQLDNIAMAALLVRAVAVAEPYHEQIII